MIRERSLLIYKRGFYNLEGKTENRKMTFQLQKLKFNYMTKLKTGEYMQVSGFQSDQ